METSASFCSSRRRDGGRERPYPNASSYSFSFCYIFLTFWTPGRVLKAQRGSDGAWEEQEEAGIGLHALVV